MKRLILAFSFIGTIFFSFAQTESKWHIGLESGGGGTFGEINDAWSVRQSVNSYNSYYGDSYSSGSLLSNSDIFYLGLKTEYNFNKNLSLALGIRNTIVSNDFSGHGTYGNYFYLKTSKNTSTETEYFRVKSIDETNYYLGIPLEIRYAPLHWGQLGFYGKFGEEIGYLLNSTTRINFLQESMSVYQEEILKNIEVELNSFYARFNLGVGISYTTGNNWKINLDLIGSSYFLTSNNSTLMDLKSVKEVQLSIMAPINFSKKR